MGSAVAGVGDHATRPRTVAGGGRGRDRLQTAYRAPETAVEKALALLWEKTLGIQPIGIDDDFIELGGDSIEAIQVQHAIHRDFDLRVKNTEFWPSPRRRARCAIAARPRATLRRGLHEPGDEEAIAKTLRLLAALAGRPGAGGTMKAPDDARATLLCTLVAGGTGAPLYLVPSVGSTPLSLVRLARAIDPRALFVRYAARGHAAPPPHA
jgi:hypothetical protein